VRIRAGFRGLAIDFQRSFDLDFEYGADSPATAIDYSSIAFYYAE
jgi:hypothetical protein